MKKSLSRVVMSLLLTISLFMPLVLVHSPAVASYDHPFPDIRGHWGEVNMHNWWHIGLAGGYGDGNFRPNEVVNRAEFISFLNRAFGFRVQADIDFSDVATNDWFSGEVASAIEVGYVQGFEDGTFRPYAPVSRIDAAEMLYKAYKLNLEEQPWSMEGYFDLHLMTEEQKVAANALVYKQLMVGSQMRFGPSQTITRAETIAILDRAAGEIHNRAGTFGPEEGQSVISRNVTVSVPDVTLRNLIIEGDLYLSEGIGDGDVTLHNVVVKGNTIVAGGGANSVNFTGSTEMPHVIITDPNGAVRVVFLDESSSGLVSWHSGGSFEGQAPTTVTLSPNIPAGSTVQLVGNFTSISVNAPQVAVTLGTGSTAGEVTVSPTAQDASLNLQGSTVTTLNLQATANVEVGAGSTVQTLTTTETAAQATVTVSEGGSIETLNANSALTVTGQGSITNANINADGVSLEKAPENVTIDPEVVASIGGTEVPGTPPPPPPPPPPAPGPGPGPITPPPTTTPVSAITVTTTPVDVTGLAHDAGAVSVTLATATAGAEIRYTTDGSTPTSASTLYAGPFTVTNPDGINGGTVVVKAIGIKSGMNNSAVTTKNVVYNAASALTVNTTAEFVTAIETNSVGTITLGGDITGNVTATRAGSNNFSINFGTYVLNGNLNVTANSVTTLTFNGSANPSITGNLTVAAGSATVTNNINVGGTITISDVGNNSWIEEADGNSITLTDSNGATIVINGNPADITVSATADGGINITANSPVTITVDAGATVSSITASGAATGTTIVNNGTVENVTADADIAVENNSGAITVAGTGTVGASGTAVGSVTGTATIVPVTNITATLEVDAQLRMVSTPTANITSTLGPDLFDAGEGEYLNVTSANQGIVDVVDPAGLAITAEGIGTTTLTVRVYNAQDELIKLGTRQVTVRPQQITAASATIVSPVLGATPQTAAQVESATGNADYTVTSVIWNEALTAAGNFKAGETYTATVTLASKNDKAFQAGAFTPIVAGSASVGTTTTLGTGVGNRVTFTVTFPATEALEVASIEVTTQPTKMTYAEGTDDELALNGMVVTATNNDGSTTVVTFTDGAAGYTANPANGATLDNATHDGNPVVITHTASGETANTANLTVAAPKEIVSVTAIGDITVAYGTPFGGVGLPATVEVTFDDASTETLAVTWDGGTPAYDGDTAGTYAFEGTITLVTGIANTAGHTAEVNVTVSPAAPTAVDFTGVTANGVSGTSTTTELTLTFDVDPASLALGDIFVSGADKVALSGSGTTRTLTISNITVNNGEDLTVTVMSLFGYLITPTSRDVAVWVEAADPAPAGFDFDVRPGSVVFEISNIVNAAGDAVDHTKIVLDGNALFEFKYDSNQHVAATFNFSYLGLDGAMSGSTITNALNYVDLATNWMGEAFLEMFDDLTGMDITLIGTYDGVAFEVELLAQPFANQAAIRPFVVGSLVGALSDLINDAQTLKDGTPEGTGLGQAPGAAHSSLDTAILLATSVKDSVGPTTNTLYGAINDLKQAMMSFNGAIVAQSVFIPPMGVTPAETPEGVAVQVNVAIGSVGIADGTPVAVNLHTGTPAGAVVGIEATGMIGSDGTAVVQFDVPDNLTAGNYYFVATADGVDSGGHLFVVEALMPTADLTFNLTAPVGPGNMVNVDQNPDPNKFVVVNVVSGTESVTIVGTKLAAQSVVIAGTHADHATLTPSDASITLVVDTSAISAGGTYNFMLTVSEATKDNIVYGVSVTVADAPAPAYSFATVVINDSYTTNNLIWLNFYPTGEGDPTTIDYNDVIVNVGGTPFQGEAGTGTPANSKFTVNVMEVSSGVYTGIIQISSEAGFENGTVVTVAGQNKLGGSGSAAFTAVPVNTSALSDAIAAANAAKVGVLISTNGEDVPSGTDWATQEVNDALDAAITTATVALGTVTTDQEVTDAVAALNGAVAIYNAAKADGLLALAPQGQLLDAEAGAHFTGVLYERAGNIYYNQQDNEGNWASEVMIGAGVAGRLAIDSGGSPHIAYTTSAGAIGYTTHNGDSWTTVVLIESNHGGTCYWPDIAVDSSGNPRIIYVDTMGDTVGTQQHPDVMYAYKSNGSFVKQLRYSGSYDSSWKQGTYPAEKNPRIAIDSHNNVYVLYQWRTYDHGMGVYHDRGLTVVGANSQGLGYVGSNTNRFDIFDLKVLGGKLYALYRDNTNVKVSEMIISANGDIVGNQDRLIFAASSAYSLYVNGGDIVVGSKDGNNLRVHYNPDATTYTDVTVSGNAVSMVYFNGAFQALYTDSSDGDGIVTILIVPAP